jgi:GT2 family glycosyltransferase
MSTPRARVTVAILNFDGKHLLDVVVPSVLAMDGASDARVLIVDNGSSDGSIEHVKSRWPSVEVLSLPENIGVAAALNRAVEATGGDYLALLNNDIELEPNWLADLLVALEAHPEAASASGKLLRFDDRTTIDAAGDLILWSGVALNRGHGMPDDGRYDAPQPVFAACAGAALYRRSAFEIVGPFDESFFAYLEDIDWGLRAQLAGLTSRYVPQAVGFHMGGATTRTRRGFYGRLQRRNTLLLIAKDFPLETLVRHGWKIVLHQALWLASSAREGMLLDHLRAWAEAVIALPGTLRARRGIQRRRVVGARELDATLENSPPWGSSTAARLMFELAPLRASRRAGARL